MMPFSGRAQLSPTKTHSMMLATPHCLRSPPKALLQPKASTFLPSRRLLSKRQNHLRPKLLKLLQPPTTLHPRTPHDHLLLHGGERVQEELHFVQEQDCPLEAEVIGEDPLLALSNQWSPRPVLGLSLRFAALLAVQTIVAVLFLGGGFGVEEKRDGGREFGELVGFEKKLREIREMAREAREDERRELAGENGSEAEEGGGLNGLRSRRRMRMRGRDSMVVVDEDLSAKRSSGSLDSSSEKLGFVRSSTKKTIRNAPKGFDGSKRNDKRHVDVPQIDDQNSSKRSIKLREPRQLSLHESGVTTNVAELKDSVVSEHFSSDGTAENQETYTDTTVSTEGSGIGLLADVRNGPSLGESNLNSFISLADQKKANIMAAKQTAERHAQLKTQTRLFSTEKSQNIGSEYRSDSERPLHDAQAEDDEVQSVSARSNEHGINTKLWWLKLPYVLAIFLYRGSEPDSPRGLYSLKKTSFSDDGDSSYTVVFQDRGDATNFCYLLESFFEDLPDFRADIIPLTIQELYEAVELAELNPIVVRKGQIQLYAGQPLAEVETAFLSLLV